MNNVADHTPDTGHLARVAERILVADDSETITSLLRSTLESNGYAVVTASNGIEAYEAGRDEAIDLVILDQLMPGLLGLEVIDRWRADGVDFPIIMLTGVDDDQVVVDSLEKGAVDHVRKPFRMPELLARIKQNCRARMREQ